MHCAISAADEVLVYDDIIAELPQDSFDASIDYNKGINTRDCTSAVTYTLGGRLGDNLLAYLHAKWISYRYNIPLLCKPFPYFDQLVAAEKEQIYTSSSEKKFRHVVELKKNGVPPFDRYSHTLYVITYFPESLEEHRLPEYGENPNPGGRQGCDWPHFTVQWDEKPFANIIKQLIAPRYPISLVVPPADCISVAIHVRKDSGGYDHPLLQETPLDKYNPNQEYADLDFPLKCVPDSYYVEQIQRVLSMFKGQKLYFFMFTDDPNPHRIATKFEHIFRDENITFHYRQTGNNHYSNVLEDLFSMPNFDCLIRPDSNLSIVASKLSNNKVLIMPLTHKWEGKKLIIDKVGVILRSKMKKNK